MSGDEAENRRSVLGPSPAGNNISKPEKPISTTYHKKDQNRTRTRTPPAAAKSVTGTTTGRMHYHHHFRSLNASCSSDVSSDSFQSGASTGSSRSRSRKQPVPKSLHSHTFTTTTNTNKRCAWVTPNTEPCYVAFHDQEWGVQVHDDKKLFELLVFSGALAELTWPTILRKRHMFREVFADFDPVSVSQLNEKRVVGPGSIARSLLSEVKLRSVIENARQITKIINEFGSFDQYIWSFVNYKPIVNSFRYARQVPAKNSKADVISKDLLKRGFMSVSATVIYSFMQTAGITNDHLVTCFRYHECINHIEVREEVSEKMKEEEKGEGTIYMGLAKAMDEMSLRGE